MSTLSVSTFVEPMLIVWLVTSSCLNLILVYVLFRLYSKDWSETISGRIGEQIENVARENPFLGTLFGLSAGAKKRTESAPTTSSNIQSTSSLLSTFAADLAPKMNNPQNPKACSESNIQWDHINRLFPKEPTVEEAKMPTSITSQQPPEMNSLSAVLENAADQIAKSFTNEKMVRSLVKESIGQMGQMCAPRRRKTASTSASKPGAE